VYIQASCRDRQASGCRSRRGLRTRARAPTCAASGDWSPGFMTMRCGRQEWKSANSLSSQPFATSPGSLKHTSPAASGWIRRRSPER
jgi:hypothetical protein